MEEMRFNRCQSSLEELELHKYPKEVQDQFFNFINNVPFIRWMVSPDRPLISEVPRDEFGRAIIDITKPPILEGSNYFRQAALTWQETGKYTHLKPNINPNSDFGKWLTEERRRGWDGLVNPDTGMWITGDYYWMLNYNPIHMVVKQKNGLEIRATRHPKFWDGQFLISHYVWQSRQNGHHSAYLSSRGRGKAHPYSQIVYTPDGAKLWGDIQVGDVLFGNDGNLTKVTAIPFDDEEKIYTVSLSDGRKLQCTSGHLFYVRDHRKHPQMRVVDLWQIMHDDYAHKRQNGETEYYFSIPNNKKVEFNPQKILIDPYTLGLLIGDGCLTKSCQNVAELTSDEEDFKFYKTQVPYEMYCRSAKYSHGIKINNVCGILEYYKLLDRTSENKFIPKEFLFNSSEVRMALLQGLMDTDGTVRKDTGVPVYSTTSFQLAKDIKWLCHSLGYNSTISIKQGKYKDEKGEHLCKVCYNIQIYTNDCIFRLQRKLCKLSSFKSAYSRSKKDWVKIVDIKYSHKEKAKCVIVDNESHCYLIGDFIVTHNTSFASSMLCKRFIVGEASENRSEIQCLVTAADRTKLMGTNQILDVFVDGIDFCAKNTYFDSMRLKSSSQEMYWEMGYKTQGSEVAYGSRNSVSGIISGVNQDKLNGSRGVLYLIEEAGIFKNLLSVWSMIRPSVEQGTSVFGQLVAYGTSGDDESDFTSFAEMFYSPDGYNINALENVFDKEGEGRRTCAMFYPAYLNYDDSCMDEDGNSNVTKALLYLLRDRYKVKYGSTDINAITKRISQYPIVPQEAIIRGQFSPFPVTELNERINQLDNNPNEYDDVYVGDLVQDGADIKFVNSIDIPIRDFPHKDNKITGAIEIFEMPQKNLEGKVPAERYISSCLKKGEKVNTVEGLKSVEDVTLEDKLINIDGEEVNIVNLQQYDNVNPVYNVKLYGVYNSTTFSEEHPIYCATPDLRYHHSSVAKRDHIPYRYFAYDFQFKPVKDLHIGDVVKAPNIYRKQKPFLHYWKDEARIDRKIKNPLNNGDFWWLLGLIIGDGWASCNGYSVHISFNAKEVQYINKARSIVETVFERSFDVCKNLGTCIETSFCCQTFNQFIRDNIGCGAINKQLPEWIKYIPESFKKQLVLGYLASDGSITRNQLEFVSISLKLLNDFQDILFSLGIAGGVSLLSKNSFGQIKGRIVNNQPKYHLRISRTYTQKVKEWDATDIKLQRCSALNLVTIHDYKRMWMSDDLNYIYFKVADIKTEEYVGKVYNFECGTHTFMCNYIPTHNCDPYDNDESNTKSLGSFFVLDTWTDRIVAEYTGRPQFAEDFYEITRKLCLFYNAKVMYENNLMGMYSYYSKRNCVHLLAETPEYLKEKQLITSIGYGNKSCGIRATVPIIKYGFRLIRDWLLKPVTRVEKDADGNEVEVNTSNLYYIRNRALLKELALWNPYDNFDRVLSMVQLILYREEKMILYQGNMARRDRTVKSFSNDDYWERNYKRSSQKQWADDAENKAQTYIKPDLYQPRVYKLG